MGLTKSPALCSRHNIFTKYADELKRHINQLNIESKMSGLSSKTKVMLNRYVEKKTIKVGDKEPEEVKNCIYLGQQTSGNSNAMKDIERRAKLVWRAFGKHQVVFKNKLPICFKRNVFESASFQFSHTEVKHG